MARSEWMYTGDMRDGITYDLRPGVDRDRYSQPNELVWRYLSMQRFEAAIESRSLFFTRLSYYATYADHLEGSNPWPLADGREQMLREQGIDIAQYNRDADQYHLKMLQTVLVNCWHKREYESMPMWERYGKGEDAVAIVTTLDRLIESMPVQVTVGHVHYADFSTDGSFFANPFTRAFMKSRAFEDEREVRAVLSEPPITENGRWSITIPQGEEIGRNVAVDLSTLVKKVVLSPVSSSCRAHIVKKLARVGITAPVEESELAQRPRY